MSEAVNIVIGVIDRMNLSNEDRLELVTVLSKDITVKPKKMTAQQLFHRDFKKWVIDRKILYPPKK